MGYGVCYVVAPDLPSGFASSNSGALSQAHRPSFIRQKAGLVTAPSMGALGYGVCYAVAPDLPSVVAPVLSVRLIHEMLSA